MNTATTTTIKYANRIILMIFGIKKQYSSNKINLTSNIYTAAWITAPKIRLVELLLGEWVFHNIYFWGGGKYPI